MNTKLITQLFKTATDYRNLETLMAARYALVEQGVSLVQVQDVERFLNHGFFDEFGYGKITIKDDGECLPGYGVREKRRIKMAKQAGRRNVVELLRIAAIPNRDF